MELVTPRGTFNGIELATEKEARAEGYGYYATENNVDIFLRHHQDNHHLCDVAFVKRNNNK